MSGNITDMHDANIEQSHCQNVYVSKKSSNADTVL